MAKIITINPSNYTQLGDVEISTPEEIRQKVENARKIQKTWASTGVAKRVELLRNVFSNFQTKKEELALLEAREMGMPVSQALSDVDGTMDYANWYFDNAEKYLSPEITFENDNEIHQVFYEPIGVCALIVPWNFPFANFVWGGLQSLICGNAVVMKHSSLVSFCAKFIEKTMQECDIPEGVFSAVYGTGDIGRTLANENIDMIAFTGSTTVGKELYELAGKKFIKAVMELGGSAPALIFDDADLDATAENVCMNRLANQGQCCDGLKRAIVHEDIAEEFIAKMKEAFEAKKIGNADDRSTEIGPLVSKKQLDLLVSQVDDSVKEGAIVVTGGKSLEKELGGAFYQPTVLRDITKNMRVWKEEAFGPVLPVITFKTEEEAIALANETAYGLGSYLYTADKSRVDRVSKALQAGMVSVNGTNYLMPFNPFGGYKDSGFGREHGKYGFHELTQIKVVAQRKS